MSPVSLRSLHNLLGEDDDVLTVLSLLPKKSPEDAGAGVLAALSRLNEGVDEVPLYEAAAWLYLVAGEDGRIPHSLSLVRSPGGPAEFIANEDSPVKEVVERMYSIAHDNADAPTRISIVTTDGDEDVEDPPAGNGSDDGRSRAGVLRRFLDAVRGLFNVAGEDGEPLTVVSILVRRAPKIGDAPG